MEQPVSAAEVERRKHVRIRLRPDLHIVPQKYEGRMYWVVKDPIGLRYYRFQDQEHFLLEYLDGEHTLEEAQKEFERRFRPDRLTLEDLEQFAQQLLTSGLALNESPRAGQQLYERRKKRVRSEWMQTLTNILYIKIPIFDPDKLLTRMVKHMGWVFTPLFLYASVGVMLAAVLLVATHFQTFRDKLPAYHEFFSFKTAIYLWISLGIVKVIHEFGHGLSCKAFGGEVHEMGALFLCLSPCLYCNVTDAWTMPSKWRRIIISGAGIWVELIIASIATFVWWNSSSHPFVHNLSLSLMVVCSISTVVFNANPLMRYDGYYVVADWLEVPNLRDRSNRFLKNTMLEVCFGVEVQPEPYMALDRKILFIVFAIVSYIYRWVVTFSILFFLNNWLPPKLRIISTTMAVFAAGSMVVWPMYRLGKNIYQRGRLPDMKRQRVVISSCVMAALLLVIVFVPLPISRVIQTGVIQLNPNLAFTQQIPVVTPGTLVYLNDIPYVKDEGTELGRFSNPDLVHELESLKNDKEISTFQRDHLKKDLANVESQRQADPEGKKRAVADLNKQISSLDEQIGNLSDTIRAKQQDVDGLLFKARIKGRVYNLPHVEEIGKYWDPAENKLFCTIGDPKRLIVKVPITNNEFKLLREDMEAAEQEGQELDVTLRVKGLAEETWKGRLLPLPPMVAQEGEIPPQLTTRHGGPLAVQPGSKPGVFVPQNQQYLIMVEIIDPPSYIAPGTLAQVKIHCRWRTARWWVWNKITDIFDLPLW